MILHFNFLLIQASIFTDFTIFTLITSGTPYYDD